MINPNICKRVYVIVNSDRITATITKGQATGRVLELRGRYYDTKFEVGKRLRPLLKYSIISNEYWLDARE